MTEGLTLKRQRPKRYRSAVTRKARPMPAESNQQWAMDFMHDTLTGGQTIRLLTSIDLCTREFVALQVAKGFTGANVAAMMSRAGEDRGKLPSRIRVDNGTEFTSPALNCWAYWNSVALDFSRPGRPVDNAFIESFNGRLQDECLNSHWFYSLDDARGTIHDWRRNYNELRPRSALGDRSPSEFAAELLGLSPGAPYHNGRNPGPRLGQ